MNESTLLSNLKTTLLAQKWTGSSNVVFGTGSVLATPNTDEAMQGAIKAAIRTPICLLQLLGAESDPEHDEEPDLLKINFNARLIVNIPGDAVGENAVLGANKTGGSIKSEGRGLVEVEQELYNAIGKLNALESYSIQNRMKGAQAAAQIAPSVYLAWRDYLFEAWVTAT